MYGGSILKNLKHIKTTEIAYIIGTKQMKII